MPRKPKTYDTADGRPLWGTDEPTPKKRKPKEFVPKACRCGCGEMTKGGEFAMGHDARYKSHLIREAKANNSDAMQELERRGWMKFYEKSVGNEQRKAAIARGERPARLYVDGTTPEDRAAARLEVLAKMKKAYQVLAGLGRVPKATGGDKFVMVTKENYEMILTGDHPDFDAREKKKALTLQGIDSKTKA